MYDYFQKHSIARRLELSEYGDFAVQQLYSRQYNNIREILIRFIPDRANFVVQSQGPSALLLKRKVKVLV